MYDRNYGPAGSLIVTPRDSPTPVRLVQSMQHPYFSGAAGANNYVAYDPAAGGTMTTSTLQQRKFAGPVPASGAGGVGAIGSPYMKR